MGFWKQLFGIEKIPYHLKPSIPSQPPPERPKQETHNGAKIIPAKTISEPVLSIIKTLKDGEWSFVKITKSGVAFAEFTHEWFGHKLEVGFDAFSVTPVCLSDWMTKDERCIVGELAWQIYQGRVKWEKEQSLAKQRESFMNLVKEPNETN